MKHLLIAVSLAAVAAAAPATAFTFFSTGATSGPAPGDPGLAAFETAIVTFDTPSVAGVLNTTTGPVGLFQGTSGSAAAPAGDTSIYQAAGTMGSSIFDIRGYAATTPVRTISVYIGSVDAYNHIDVLDANLNSLGTINGSMLPGNNGDQGASITNRRLYITFGANETVGGLDFHSDGVAFEYDTIGASRATFPGVANGATPATLPTASIPEPASWILLIAGFAMTGFAARRRRVSVAA